MESKDNEGKERVRVAQWVRKPKDDYKNQPSYQSLIKKYGQMPCGYWNFDGWKGYKDDGALYTTNIGTGKKMPKITDRATTATGLRVDELRQDPKKPGLVGSELGNPDDNSVEDLQSTREDRINRLIGHKKEVDEMTNVYQDPVGDTESNEESTNTKILINRNERGA